jgi:hypothetical protein
VISAVGSSLDPGVVSQIRAHPDVAWAVPDKSLYIGTPLNTSGDFRLFGVPETAIQFLIDTRDLRLKDGRLLRPRSNEILLLEEFADALELQVDVYTPIGLTLNLLAPVPWLFTLPMPLTVVAVSAGLIAWTLSRLGPVSVIERR